ncbi:restriction endonuclease subunit S [Paenibacillus chungangensis]|uniref:Restriction endonuclease subunit S n=1 Tax=Paenibacillus chungangensis TaxID=696535 RepID=A0ABW3HVY8_9BACL
MSKKKAKSREELLEEALVPVEEQPYEVPGNWVWVRLSSISKLISDGSHNPPPKQTDGIPMLSGKNVINNTITLDTDRFITKTDFELENRRTPVSEGDVLLTIVGTIGRSAIVQAEHLPFALQRSVALIKTRFENNAYLKHYMQSPAFQNFLKLNAKGTAQKGVYLKTLKSSPIPLPPLNEQKRIVDKVERLLTKINQAKQLIEEAKATFELRRAAILDKAFRGELTEKWRQESFGTVEQNWESTTIGNVCSESFYGPRFGKNEYSFEGIPTIRTTDMTKNGEIILKDPPKVVIGEKNIDKFRLKKGDLLVTRTGSIGTMAVFNEEYLAVPSAYLIRFRFIEQVNTRFMFYYLMSPKGQKMMGLGTTAITQPNINAETIKKMPFLLPSFEEQIEIVQVLDSFWHMEQKLIERLGKYNYLEKLEQSILMYAFSGKLRTNDVNDSIPTV